MGAIPFPSQPFHDASHGVAYALPALRHIALPVSATDTGAASMFLPASWRNSPDDTIARMIGRMIAGASKRHGDTIPQAYARVARDAGVPPGCIETIHRGRRKAVSLDQAQRIAERFAIECRSEIAQLTAELEIARRMSARPDATEIFDAMAAVERARKALETLTK